MLCIRAVNESVHIGQTSDLQLRDLRIHNHNLSLLTMRARRTVQKHGLGTRDWHIERPDVGLSIFEGDVAAVHAPSHGCACGVSGGLRDGVVAVGELELQDVADGGDDGVGDEGVWGGG